MNVLQSALQLPLALPAYWRACRAARQTMDCTVQRIPYGKSKRQYALLAEPPPDRLRPGHYAFYFHGGGWTFGQPETFLPAARPWLANGYRVILPSHRRPPRVGLHRVVADCKAAVLHLLPDEPIFDLQFGGISSGAHLASLLAIDDELWANTSWGKPPSRVLACAGPFSFRDLQPFGVLHALYGRLNPIDNLPKAGESATRWLLLHGDNDGTVPLKHSEKFLAQLQAHGYAAALTIIEGGDHLDAGRWMFGHSPIEKIRSFIG